MLVFLYMVAEKRPRIEKRDILKRMESLFRKGFQATGNCSIGEKWIVFSVHLITRSSILFLHTGIISKALYLKIGGWIK